MANSGQIQTNTSFGYVRLAWSISSQNIANNTSTISYALSINRTGNISSSASKSYSIKINGVTVASGTTTIGGTGTKTIKTGTTTISHNANGAKTFALSFSQQVDITWSGTWIGTVTGSGNGTLNTIPRATTPTLSAATINMGSTLTITLNRASSSFKHTLKYGFGSQSGTIGTNIDVSTSWLVPINFANQLPNGTSGTGRITCETYNNGVLIGTTNVSIVFTVPNNVIPTINSVTIGEAVTTPDIAATFNNFVQHNSKAFVTTNASGVYASTIKNYKVMIQDANKTGYPTLATYHGSNITTDILSFNTTQIRFAIVVTDSRGRTASAVYNKPLLAYEKPKITGFTAFRCNADGSANYEGTRLNVQLNFNIATVNNLNGKYYEVLYRLKGDTSSWDGKPSVVSGNVYSRNDNTISGSIFSGDNAYELRLRLFDTLSSAVADIDIPVAFTLLDFRSTGKGFAVGKVSEKDNMEVALDLELTGNFIQEAIQKPVLQNGWTDYGTATGYYSQSGYWKDKCGVVHLSGMIKGGTITGGTLLFTLPIGYRPAKAEVFAAMSGGALCRIDIDNIGQVLVQSGASTGWLSLSGITFKAA